MGPLARRSISEHFFKATAALSLLSLLSGFAPLAHACTEAEIADPRSPCKAFRTREYELARATMKADQLPTKSSGQGTTVVQIEPAIPWVEARNAETGQPLFGDCRLPASRRNDQTGYAPEGKNCRIRWVQCFGKNCTFRPGGAQTHATNVAQGILAAAPETNIIALKLWGFSGANYANVVDWLLTPSPQFDDQSPAEYWNVVALNASATVLGGRSKTQDDVSITALFSETCELENPGGKPRPEKYLSDWLRDRGRNYKPQRWLSFKTHSAKLRAAGIVPVFVGENRLSEYPYVDEDGNDRRGSFVSPNGVSFPACLAEVVAVSAIAPDYKERTNKWRFVGTNSHPQLTNSVAPGGSASYAAPLVAGAIAVLRSPDVAQAASIEEILGYLQTSSNPPAPAGISCIPAQDEFPVGEHPSLGCDSGVLPYDLPVLDLAAAVEAASDSSNR